MGTKRIAPKVKMLFFLSFLLLSLSTCVGGFGFVFKEHLFGNYYLTAPDDIEQCALSYRSESYSDIYGGNFGGIVIDETVFAVGYNEKYLIAKQCKISYRENGKFLILWTDYERIVGNIRYYILPIEEEGMNWRTKNGLIGPLDSLAFENKRKELGISDLKFTKNIDIP